MVSKKTGIERMDKILGGGIPEESVILLSGGPGTGKTLLSLKILMEGASKGEKCAYISLNETKDEIIRASEGISSLSSLKKYIGKNLFINNIPMGQSNVSMKRFVDIISEYPQIDRIVIDNVNKLLMFTDTEKSYRIYLSELVRQLKSMKMSLLICETKGDNIDSGNNESFECDGVIQLSFLDLEEKPMRSLIVHKMRYSPIEPKVPHEVIIDSKDIRMSSTKVI